MIFILRGDETNCNLIPKVMDMYLVQKVDLNAVKTKNERKKTSEDILSEKEMFKTPVSQFLHFS